MTMEFAINYSPVLGQLVQDGVVQVERFKCPAWPDLLKEAQRVRPVYVHFPLGVGSGIGCPLDEEIHGPADLDRIASLLEMTGTRYINTHFIPAEKHYPNIPPGSREPRHIEQVITNTLRDLEPLVERFGAEHVLVENVVNEYGFLTLAVLPEVIARVLEKSGCGFLFDHSHARLAARNLGLDEREYSASMPVEHIREVHVTGLQRIEGVLFQRIQAAGGTNGFATLTDGQMMDHFPMTAEDWPELEWLAGRLGREKWRTPWVVAYEYGGVGGLWEVLTDQAVYVEQLPRMANVLKRGG